MQSTPFLGIDLGHLVNLAATTVVTIFLRKAQEDRKELRDRVSQLEERIITINAISVQINDMREEIARMRNRLDRFLDSRLGSDKYER